MKEQCKLICEGTMPEPRSNLKENAVVFDNDVQLPDIPARPSMLYICIAYDERTQELQSLLQQPLAIHSVQDSQT